MRYVDLESLKVREDLVRFTECDTGIIGFGLPDKIKTCLQAYGLDLSCVRGQAYDGEGIWLAQSMVLQFSLQLNTH